MLNFSKAEYVGEGGRGFIAFSNQLTHVKLRLQVCE